MRLGNAGQEIAVFPSKDKVEDVASNMYRNIGMLFESKRFDNLQGMGDIRLFR